MKRWTAVGLALWVVALGAGSPAAAFEGGGRKPSEAPLIEWGQHYSGKLNNHKSDANYGGDQELAFYRLPPVGVRDTVTVNWHVLPFTHWSGFPVCMALAQGIDDFNWGTVFGELPGYCTESGPLFSVAGSGTASTSIVIQNSDASSYLEFSSDAGETNSSEFETFPYDFSVEAPRHYLGLAVSPKRKVHADGVIRASATLADGQPVPDGLEFHLKVTWGRDGVAFYRAASVGGGLTFALALPAGAVHEYATFLVSRAIDASYQGVRGKIKAVVQPASDSACTRIRHRVRVLARRHRSLKRRSAGARGANRRRLLRRTRKVKRELRKARSREKSLCG